MGSPYTSVDHVYNLTGPILLFELCDLGTLGSWLISQPEVTEDLQDKMITFSLHIARGLQELHAHKVKTYSIAAGNIFETNTFILPFGVCWQSLQANEQMYTPMIIPVLTFYVVSPAT